jgi:carbamoyltransferase
MYILGISAFYHDSAACLLFDGDIVAAAQEERFTRIKHDPGFPENAIRYCLEEAGITALEVSAVVYYEKPFVKFERLIETYLAFAPRGLTSFVKAIPVWVKDKLFQKRKILAELQRTLSEEVEWEDRILFSEHHLSHAASAFYPSPFSKAAVLTLDGVGEWTTTSLAIGDVSDLTVIDEIHFPHSIGLLYSAFTYYVGFKVNSGEYKVMGLAPYGEPVYADLIKERLLNVAEDGTFQLDMQYFSFATGLQMTNDKFHQLFGGPPRDPESALTQRHMDLAASVQKVTEDLVVRLARSIKDRTGQQYLCLAGGVALNCVANGILLREGIFDDIWIQPAAGDAGGALGAALAAWHLHFGAERTLEPGTDSMRGSYLGPEFSDDEIEKQLTEAGAVYERITEEAMISRVAECLANEQAVGWMQGRMEFGPRALGGRSILANPQSVETQRVLNLKVKYRESFRPFAPSVLREDVSAWFEMASDSPYMLIVADVQADKIVELTEAESGLFGIDKLNVPKSKIPAVTHVDYSARIQTVHSETNSKFYSLISAFKSLTGCPVVVNTSFNVRGEPIVCSPTDAFKCFMGTGLDTLAIGNFVLYKDRQNPELVKTYLGRYALD